MKASQSQCFSICCRFFPQKHKWMKKVVLRCNRGIVVTWFFNLQFFHIYKEGTLGTRLINQFFFLWTRQLFENGPKKKKTFISLNWSQNEKVQLEKDMRTFCKFIFGIWSWCQSIQDLILHQNVWLIFSKM